MTVPRLASYFERDYCAAASVHLLREREARYPALVTAGKLSADAASGGLERARVIVAQWRWVIDRAGPVDPPWDDGRGVHGFGAYDFELAEELDTVATRARAMADAEPRSWERRELADLCEALAWWQQRDPTACTCRIVREVSCERRLAASRQAHVGLRRAA